MKSLMPSDTNIPHGVFPVRAAPRLPADWHRRLTIGTGLDVIALRELAARAKAARAAGGVKSPLRIWAMASTHLAGSPSDVPALRKDVRGLAYGGARFAFDSSFGGKAVPKAYQAILRERLSCYNFTYHGKTGSHPNARLFEDRPDIEEYLVDRMLLVGTAEQCRDRLISVASEAGLDGFWMPIIPSEDVSTDVWLDRVRHAGDVFGDAAGLRQ